MSSSFVGLNSMSLGAMKYSWDGSSVMNWLNGSSGSKKLWVEKSMLLRAWDSTGADWEASKFP